MFINISYLFLVFFSFVFTKIFSFRTINPNIDQIQDLGKIYITTNESIQYHLNEFFSGFNLKYSFKTDDKCLPKIDVFQSLRYLNNWTTNLTSKNVLWSFYKDKSSYKFTILCLDKINNEIYSANLDIRTNLVNFVSFAKIANSSSQCTHFITMQNHSIFAPLCSDNNNNEYLMIYNLLEKNESLKKIGGPFYLTNKSNNSRINYFMQKDNLNYFLRYWKFEETHNNMSLIEIYKFDSLSKELSLEAILNNNTFNLKTLGILDLKLKNEEVFFSELNKIIIRFRYNIGKGVDFYFQNSEILINLLFLFNYGSFSNQLNLVLASNMGYVMIADWTDTKKPILKEKYALLPFEGNILYLHSNEDYLMYYASLNNETNYFAVFKRRSKLLNHLLLLMNFTKDQAALFEFIPENNNVFCFINNSIVNYILYDAVLRINASNIKAMPEYELCNTTINVVSKDTFSNRSYEKNFTLPIQLLNPQDTSLYSAFNSSMSHSYIDYPGQNQFLIDDFYVGPDILYNFSWVGSSNNDMLACENNITNFKRVEKNNISNPENVSKNSTKDTIFRINKINKLDINYSFFSIDPSSIIFHNMMISPLNISDFIWFVQISNYTVYVYICETNNSEQPPICQMKGNLNNLNSLIANISLAYQPNLLWFALKLDNNLFNIQFYDFLTLQNLNINLPICSSLLCQIFDFTIIDFKIILALTLNKSISIIDLNKFNQTVFVIDANLMASYGLPFFSPIGVQSQYLHKNILFILDMISVIIVDISNIYEGEIIIIKSIISEATRKMNRSFYSLSISRNTLVIISDSPQIIEEYSISNYYLVYMRKRYPLYNYTIIMKSESKDFNDASGILFIHAFDSNKNAVVLIYNFVECAHSVLHSILPLNTTFPKIFVQTTGISSIYLSVVYNTNIQFYQIYKNSTLLLNSLALANCKSGMLNFNISISNSFNENNIFNVTYNVTTWDSGVNITLKNQDNSNITNLILLKPGFVNNFQICPFSLFNGSVISYSISCNTDCGKVSNSIHLKSPLSFNRTIFNNQGFNDLFLSNGRAFLQTSSKLLTYSISEDEKFTLIDTVNFFNTTCKKTVFYEEKNLTVSACRNVDENYVIFVMDSSMDPNFFNISVPIDNMARMMIFKDYLIILNAPEESDDCTLFESSIFIYNFTNNRLMFMDTIDADDVELDHLYICDMDVADSDYSDSIRFFVMDKYNGLRIVDFNTSDVHQQIQYSINLIDYIEKDGVDQEVIFSAVKVIETYPDVPNSPIVYILILSTINFHKYEIALRINSTYQNNSDLQMKIVKCYLRYGFYSSANRIFSLKNNNSWFFIIPHLLSSDLMINYNDFSKQILIIFDRRDMHSTPKHFLFSNRSDVSEANYEYRRVFGGFTLNYSSSDYFGNILVKQAKNTSEIPKFSLIYKNPINLTVDILDISPNISIFFDCPYSNDSFLNLSASNDYNQITLSLNIRSIDSQISESKGWIIGLVIALLIVAVILIFVVKKYGKNDDSENENEDDFLDDEEEEN